MNDQSQKPVQCTLAFPFREGKILLGMGTRGVNKNRWNGFGGKMDAEDVSLTDCAVRELGEEVGLTADEKDLRYHGSVTFHWGIDVPGLGVQSAKSVQVHMFTLEQWQGDPVETESTTTPTWFPTTGLPYADMAPDNPHWLPLLLERKYFVGDIWYSTSGGIDKVLVRELSTPPVLA